MESSRCLLKMPGDVLSTLLACWLSLKDVVKVDTASCQRDVREHFLATITKYSFHSFSDTVSIVDCGLRRLAKRNIPCRLQSLSVNNVTDHYEENIAHCTEMLRSLTELNVCVAKISIYEAARWLELVAPSCRNLRIINVEEASAEDVEWVRAPIANAPRLTEAWLSLRNEDSCPTYPL